MTGYFQREGGPYLSSLKEGYLKKLGRATGLDYHRLQTDNQLLVDLLGSMRYAESRPARREISWTFGAAALTLLTAVYLMPLLRRRYVP
jgi:hypothetical protein